ncbi:hypothetical protein LCGC14_1205330 [marine sediment metagenome]|uniref:Uncharacterized protein n=1 Tax=marine sediment metagenome TaxID=412755 RepID=A0A0F9LFI4_9ZZZZ
MNRAEKLLKSIVGTSAYMSSLFDRLYALEKIEHSFEDFANWLHHNWFIPHGSDFEWKQNTGHPEYQRMKDFDEFKPYTFKELYELFINNKGEF